MGYFKNKTQTIIYKKMKEEMIKALFKKHRVHPAEHIALIREIVGLLEQAEEK